MSRVEHGEEPAPASGALASMFARAWSSDPAMSELGAAARLRRALLGHGEHAPKLARYQLERVIGTGAMGEVWAAHDPELRRDVAIKISNVTVGTAGRMRAQRLAREAQAMARLSDPNVVQIYDVGTYELTGTADGPVGHGVFVAMELVRGSDLEAWCRASPRSWREIVEVFVQAGRGLAAAHAVGLVHRDFKPGNVLVGDDGRVRVGDFGLAAMSRDAGPAPIPTVDPIDEMFAVTLTREGAVIGTPLYMAPEQHAGAVADAASDQFAFCVALHECLHGVRPFSGDLDQVVLAKLAGRLTRRDPPPTLPTALERAITRGTSARPQDRWPSMQPLVAALAATTHGDRRVVAGLAAGALVGVGVVVALAGREPCPLPALADDAWSPAVRAELRAGADAARASELDALDSFVREHERMRVELCAAPAATDARTCLREASTAFTTALEQLGADGARVPAADVIAALPDPAACRITDTDASTPESDDDVHARELLARASVLASSLRPNEALALALEARSAAIGDSPTAALVRARAACLVGSALDDLSQPDAALAEFDTCHHEAVRLDRPELALLAAVSLSTLACDSRDLPAARHWLRQAEVSQRQAAPDPDMGLRMAMTRAFVAALDGDTAGAEASLRAALGECDERDCGRMRDALLYDLSEVLQRAGSYGEALAVMREAIADGQARHGPDSPELFDERIELAELLHDVGDDLAALAEIDSVIPELEAWFGHRHRRYASALAMRSTFHESLGRLEAAVRDAEDALAAAEAVLAPDDPRLAQFMNLLGNALSARGDDAAALPHYERAVVLLEEQAADSPELGDALISRGHLYIVGGQPARGIVDERRGRELVARSKPQDHPSILLSLANEAQALIALGRDREAIELYLRWQTLANRRGDVHRNAIVEVAAEIAAARARLGEG